MSGFSAPVITLMSVDFPAPFSPMRACTSPACRSNDTSCRARTPEKDFEIERADVVRIARVDGVDYVDKVPAGFPVSRPKLTDLDTHRAQARTARNAALQGDRTASAPLRFASAATAKLGTLEFQGLSCRRRLRRRRFIRVETAR